MVTVSFLPQRGHGLVVDVLQEVHLCSEAGVGKCARVQAV